jgi:RNA polymerase sigma factor (sigma-70 family)
MATARGHSSAAELIGAARMGDERAWAALVSRIEPMLRSVARRYGLSAAQIDDVIQIAWMRLFENIDALREPDAVGGWLAVTVRREAFRVLQLKVREYLTDDMQGGESTDESGPEAAVLEKERRETLARAIRDLPERHSRLMQVMLSEPGLGYRQVSARTGIPTGSIGPIRGRCLERMAGDPAVQELRD